MFKLVCCLVGIFAYAFAKDHTSFVEEHVTLHRFKSQLTQPILPFVSFGPNAETSLKK